MNNEKIEALIDALQNDGFSTIFEDIEGYVPFIDYSKDGISGAFIIGGEDCFMNISDDTKIERALEWANRTIRMGKEKEAFDGDEFA